MARPIAFLLATILAISGCTMAASSRKALMVSGGVAAAAGVLVMRSSEVDSDHDGVNETRLNDDWGDIFSGSFLFIAGVTALLIGVASNEPADPVYATQPTIPQ